VEKPSRESARALALGQSILLSNQLATIWPNFADDGWFQPIVSAVFRLERDAYKLGLQGHHRGKIVLRVD